MNTAEKLTDAISGLATEDQKTVLEFVSLVQQQPQAAHNALSVAEHEPSLALDITEDLQDPNPVDDYITEVDKRLALLQEFHVRLDDHGIDHSIVVDIFCTALFMVAPVVELHRVVSHIVDRTSAILIFYKLTTSRRAIHYFVTNPFDPADRKSPQSFAPHTQPPLLNSGALETSPTQKSPIVPGYSPSLSSPLKRTAAAADIGKGKDEAHPNPSERKMQIGTSDPSSLPKTPPKQDALDDASISRASSYRSKTAAKLTKDRDGNICVLTHIILPDAANIFPFWATVDHTGKSCFANLLAFWGEEKASVWKALYDNRSITESPRNLISLAKHMHAMWDNAFFALKPVSATANEIVVQFHWLKPCVKKSSDIPRSLDRTTVLGIVCNGDARAWGAPRLAHRWSGVRISTGQLYTIRSSNPDHLPSFELLNMQWNLMRVAAMCGAAVEDASEESRSDSDDDGYKLDEQVE